MSLQAGLLAGSPQQIIDGILEGALEVDNYLASLLRAFVNQYVKAIDLLEPQHHVDRAILSGGIARNLPNLRDLLAWRTGYEVLPATEIDESLLGLRTVALVADGRAGSCFEAQRMFGRDCYMGA